MPGRSLSGKQKQAARIKRGEDPKGPPKKVAPSKSAVVSVAGLDIPTEDKLVPTKGKLNSSASKNKKIAIIAIIVACLLAAIFFGGWIFLGHTGTVTLKATKDFSDHAPAPQSLLPVFRHLTVAAGSSFQ